MSVFEQHRLGAKANNKDDMLWLLGLYFNKLVNVCAKYGHAFDEDMFIYLVEKFIQDVDDFEIRAQIEEDP